MNNKHAAMMYIHNAIKELLLCLMFCVGFGTETRAMDMLCTAGKICCQDPILLVWAGNSLYVGYKVYTQWKVNSSGKKQGYKLPKSELMEIFVEQGLVEQTPFSQAFVDVYGSLNSTINMVSALSFLVLHEYGRATFCLNTVLLIFNISIGLSQLEPTAPKNIPNGLSLIVQVGFVCKAFKDL
ncbi:hypothetical protein IPH25_02890 [bacterium]|nr:MAG: hypothetical protein IPG37_05030 [bacterium]QQR61413.1 MAG: hypothetical protein IPH25_02890 [bacterium]